MNNYLFRNRQRGLTLIEILVAMAISLLLLAGVIQIFLSSKQAYRVQDNLSRLQENGLFAMDILGRNMRAAGYPDISKNPAIKRISFSGTPITGTNGTGTASDVVTVSFDSATDCLGQQLTPGSIAVNRFSIDASNNLVCLGNGNANPQPFIEGVEDMQILYGITNGDANQSANRYVEASAAGSADWNNVVSVRICLLLSTTEDNLADQPLSFQNCNGNMVPANDRRLRRIFTSTINLRNKINTSPALWN